VLAIFSTILLWSRLLAPASAAEPAPPPIAERDVPAELRDWVSWVRSPELDCARSPAGRTCVWPGGLEVDAGATSGRWTLAVTTDREVAVALPGGVGTWPQDVRVDGRPAPVVDDGGVPSVVLDRGSHRVTARLTWSERPGSLPVPAAVGTVALRVDGSRIALPRIDSDGLRLGATADDEREGEHLGVEVSRRIVDGVPLVVETELRLRASGRGREVDLGPGLVPGTRAVALSADLPARFSADGSLVIQVRPGTYRVRFDAVHDGPVDELTSPSPGDPWPETETWAVVTDDRVRAVNLSGPPGVDPSRTTLPDDWRGLPTFAVAQGGALGFETLRRGDPDPAPNRLSLSRELWLDLDGRGLTARDRFGGEMHRGWRLDVTEPWVLGHVTANGDDLVVTESETGATGVELRNERVDLVADSRVEVRPGALPAVGWATDVVQLDVTLNLPPGFRLFAGTGIDRIDGSMVDRWSLFDLFFVLVLAMATGRLMGWPWGVVALVGLALARHEAGAPQWTWAVVLALIALQRGVPEGTAHHVVRGLRLAALLLLVAILVPFSVQHLERGLFPALDARDSYAGSPGRFANVTLDSRGVSTAEEAPSEVQQKLRKKDKYLSLQVDPKAVVQTGPGVPEWTFRQARLTWSGPVSRTQTMRLVVLSPLTNLLLAVLRVVLLGALALKLAELSRRQILGVGHAAGVLLGVGLVVPSLAVAAPSPELLQTLEARLSAPPPCGTRCVTVPDAALRVVDDTLELTLEVHAQTDASVPVPGPTKVFVPSEVRVDGRVTSAMARLSDGFLHLRVAEGVHRVQIRGPVPPVDALPLAFGTAPKHLTWSGEGWALDGLHADGTVEASVQLARMLGEASTSQSTENLTPWLEVRRQLDLGLPWRVRTVVRRVGPTDYPVSLKVPLLAGEAVTEGGFEATDGVVAVSLDRDEVEVGWLSTIPTTARIELRAPVDVPWTEVWTLSCSPLYACTTEGPAPLSHVDDGAWAPRWRVWPGETLLVDVSRPAGVEGQTTTIDAATLDLRPGRRTLLAELSLRVRSSQGGRQTVRLPEGAELQAVRLDGVARPLQLRDGRALPVPLVPGTQNVVIEWQQADPASIVDRMPAVDLGGPAVNVRAVVHPAPDRWIAWLAGPRWGPVPLMWTYVIAVLVIAPILARIRYSPLGTASWLLLGLGMTQVNFLAPLVVAGWFFALAWRRERPPSGQLAFNLGQVALVGLTVVALGCLYAAIHTGLLWQPDSQVSGGGSTDDQLVWFVDRVAGQLPRPTVVSLPLWVWRVVMLAWSLWLAASLVRWLPWAWQAWSDGGMFRTKTPSEPTGD